ncbi:KGGVGR-motif variant AAA ATPase [Pseudomonas sp. zjy_14]|uniref:KGGVGR-motif variant AAA ATPase n=1 Tax=Pseudomonas sp. zjy_14 TaxID=3367264 RepID=UPI00370B7BA9
MVAPKIVTFYSYKGGAGRTMSVANVAFLAALDGLKVLVMDWDMEAPGLAYYFRGLHDAAEAKSLKDTRGLLNIFWDWSAEAERAQNNEDVERLFANVESGKAFSECVRSLVGPGLFEKELKLDYISAGGLTVGVDDILYESALSKFSWNDFFDRYAGGAVLEKLKNWSKANYDLILIDSRTGFADVAGICTMQMPDEVALCFVLNRQNIDGVARVASAIRERRNEEIVLRAVPMRVSGSGGESSEISDAKARAVNELVRVGGFSSSAVQEDFKNLTIPAVDNLPSYETLAPFIVSDPKYDQLTLNYVQLASRLVERPLRVPSINSKTFDLVKRRLLPRHATEEFLENLTTVREIDSAISDLQQLIQSALESIVNEEYIDSDYVKALVKACDGLADKLGDLAEVVSLKMAAVDLLRAIAQVDPAVWVLSLIDKLTDMVDLYGYSFEHESQLALLEELDILLAGASTINLKLRRIEFRRRAAWVYVDAGNTDALKRTIGEISVLRKDLLGAKLAQDQSIEVVAIEVDIYRLKAEIEIQKNAFQSAKSELDNALNLIHKTSGHAESGLLCRMLFSIHIKLTEFPRKIVDVREAAEHVVAATSTGSLSQRVVIRFNTLGNIILESQCDQLAVKFCESLLGSDSRMTVQLGNYYGRYPEQALEFFKTVRDLVVIVSKHEDRSRSYSICTSFSEAVSTVRKGLIRRRRTVGDKNWGALEYEFDLLTGLFDRVGVHVETHTSELENRFFMRTVHPGRISEEDE